MMMPKFDLSGKTALITGGGTGLGIHMAKALVSTGAKVMIAARRKEVLSATVEQIMADVPGSEVMCQSVDLTSPASIQALADHAASMMGGIDIFIGNAAQNLHAPIEEVES